MWVCDFYSFGTAYHFDTEKEAYAYGKKSGFFGWCVYKLNNNKEK